MSRFIETLSEKGSLRDATKSKSLLRFAQYDVSNQIPRKGLLSACCSPHLRTAPFNHKLPELPIQQRLPWDDAFLIGCRNEDPKDLARQGTITASSEQVRGEAAQVISGQTRSVHGGRGVTPDRSLPGTHRWMSNPADGFPASIQLDWVKPITASEIHLIFDTGLHHHLTLSHQDGYTAKMHWGRPQPETIRDFAVEGKQGKTWIPLAEVTGNSQRRVICRLDEPTAMTSLRIVIKATNGLDHARICEIRAY